MSEESSALEHLTPHDLVTYSRCPFEMEMLRAQRASLIPGAPTTVRTPADVRPLPHSPLLPVSTAGHRVREGPIELDPSDELVYVDEHEKGLPLIFPADRVRLDERFCGPAATLVDPEFGLSGRPDFVVRSTRRGLFPVEFKETHLFSGFHSPRGRPFDELQVIAECRLVEAAFGASPVSGVVWYGDTPGNGRREGWIEIPYGAAERGWLHSALAQIRSDLIRAPVPSPAHCAHCEINRERLCRYAAVGYERIDAPGNPVPRG